MERLQEILLLLANPDELEDAQLRELENELTAIFDDLLAEEERTPEIIEALNNAVDAADGVRYLAGQRIEAANEEAAAEAQRLAEEAEIIADLERRIHAEDVSDDTDVDDETLDDEGDDEDETDDDAIVDDVDDVIPDDETVIPDAIVEDDELEPVAASAAAPPVPTPSSTTSRADLRSRQRSEHKAKAAKPTRTHVRIRAAGMQGHFRDRVAVEDAVLQRWFDLQGTGEVGRRRVATFEAEYPKERVLREGAITDLNAMAQEVRALACQPGGIETLTADGGLCGPVDAYYGLQSISQASRPLRARLAQYQAKRGGIRFDTPIKLSDIQTATTPTAGRAIGVVTEAQDAANTYDKSYQSVACGTEVEKDVDAVYMQLEFGRFMERTNPERKTQFTDLTLAAYARFSEQRLFNAMIANSTHLNAPQQLGATRDLLNGLNRAANNYRRIHRMDQNAIVETVIPGWVGMGLLPDDQTNALQSYQEQFAVTATKVEEWLKLRNIVVGNWFQDDFTTAASNEGGINAYPTSFKVLMYHPGAHVYVDQGELNLGVLVDSVLAVSNVFRTFSEEFWTTAMWGVESWDIEFSLCANGASAGSLQPHCGS